MRDDNRERNFEKAIARHFPGSPRNPQGNDCPDAEILAAYSERTLSAEESAAAKQHVAGCARCQEVLTQLAATAEIPLGIKEQADPREPSPAKPASPEGTVEIRPRRWRLRWLVPALAGAMAAVFLVRVVIHNRQDSQTRDVEIAVNHPAPVTPAVNSPVASQIPEADSGKPAAKQPDFTKSLPKRIPAKSLPDLENLKKSRSVASSSAPSASPPPDNLQAFSANRARGKAAPPPPAAGAGEAKQLAAPQAPKAALEHAQVQTADATVGTVVDRQFVENMPLNGRSFQSLIQLTPGAAGGAAPNFTGRQQFSVNGQRSEANYFIVDGVSADVSVTGGQIRAPGEATFWRVSAAGRIERTTDAGKTWSGQNSGVTTDLLAGFAPSEKVCWISGKAGTILLTTDGGDHWTQIEPPVAHDFNRVLAFDATHATISDASTHKRYQTSDAGTTWNELQP